MCVSLLILAVWDVATALHANKRFDFTLLPFSHFSRIPLDPFTCSYCYYCTGSTKNQFASLASTKDNGGNDHETEGEGTRPKSGYAVGARLLLLFSPQNLSMLYSVVCKMESCEKDCKTAMKQTIISQYFFIKIIYFEMFILPKSNNRKFRFNS